MLLLSKTPKNLLYASLHASVICDMQCDTQSMHLYRTTVISWSQSSNNIRDWDKILIICSLVFPLVNTIFSPT